MPLGETPGHKEKSPRTGLGLDELAMGRLAAAEEEVPPQKANARLWARLLGVVVVLALATLIAWWVRVGSGMVAGQREAAELAQKLEERKAWQYGILSGVRLTRADAAVLEVVPESELDRIVENPEVVAWAAKIAVEVPYAAGAAQLRQLEKRRAVKLAVLEALEVFREIEPARDLRLRITQQGKEIGEAEHLRRDGLPVIQKGRVHLEGETEAGLSEGERPGQE